jgi:hypothetical protein
MSGIKKPTNYLNNRDLLKEIHASKNSYCTYIQPDYHQYDLIIDFPSQPLEHAFEYISRREIIEEAKKNRASRLETETNTKIDHTTIPDTDLVFRVMTWEHIPLAPKTKKVNKKKTAKDIIEIDMMDAEEDLFEELEDEVVNVPDINDLIHIRVNFPPFQHFKINRHGSFVCVGKSHWQGDIETGEFSKDHGQLTDKLARMYIMICEKYAMKYNFRGYTYRDEMQNSAILQLTYVGLRFNEAKSNNPFAYYTAAITNSFCRVLNTEKRNQNIRDDLLELNGLNPSYTRQHSDIGYADD